MPGRDVDPMRLGPTRQGETGRDVGSQPHRQHVAKRLIRCPPIRVRRYLHPLWQPHKPLKCKQKQTRRDNAQNEFDPVVAWWVLNPTFHPEQPTVVHETGSLWMTKRRVFN